MAFQTPFSGANTCKLSFFPLPQTIRKWNDLSDSLIASAEMWDDCVAKLTTLVRARGKSSPVKGLNGHFGVSTVKYSNSDSVMMCLFRACAPIPQLEASLV